MLSRKQCGAGRPGGGRSPSPATLFWAVTAAVTNAASTTTKTWAGGPADAILMFFRGEKLCEKLQKMNHRIIVGIFGFKFHGFILYPALIRLR